jgi:hypothetical protein
MLVRPRQHRRAVKRGGRRPFDVKDLQRYAPVARSSLKGSGIHRGIEPQQRELRTDRVVE